MAKVQEQQAALSNRASAYRNLMVSPGWKVLCQDLFEQMQDAQTRLDNCDPTKATDVAKLQETRRVLAFVIQFPKALLERDRIVEARKNDEAQFQEALAKEN